MPRAHLWFLVLAFLAAPAFAQDGERGALLPSEADQVAVGNATLSHWVGRSSAVDKEIALGEDASLWFAIAGNNGTRIVVHLNVTSTSSTLSIANGTLVLDAAPAGIATQNLTLAPTVADAGVVNMSYSFAGDVYEEQNGTLVLIGPVSGGGAFTYDVGAFVPVPPPADPAIPRSWLIVGLAVLVIGGLGGAVALRQRAIKRQMNEGPRRSQVMRELEMEQKLEKAKAKDPEAAVVIQKEIRQAEQVREKRRELQILEAKRADVLKTMDLLKKRQEAGGLSKHQYDNMVAKKRTDLERIEAEIAEMERQDGGAAA